MNDRCDRRSFVKTTVAAGTAWAVGHESLATDASDVKAGPMEKVRVGLVGVGNVGFIGVGCALLTEVGMAIKAGSPYEHTFVVTHCNGRAGYFPPQHLYKEGGYEVDSTGFAPQAADLPVKEPLRMLLSLK